MNAKQILALLETRHSSDIGISEAKTGPTESGVLKLDYWAMTPSWANFRAYGYEIKVSRSDFLRDDKWRGYLPYCTDFYFVAPSKLIRADELPAEAGLLEVASTGTRFYTRKKAPSRGITIHPDILIYALMWRTGRSRENWLMQEFARGDRSAIDTAKRLGSKLAKALAEEKNELAEARIELDRRRSMTVVSPELEAAEKRLAAIQEAMDELGGARWVLKSIDRFRKAVDKLSRIPESVKG